MNLDRYGWNAAAHAEELLDLLSEEERRQLVEPLEKALQMKGHYLPWRVEAYSEDALRLLSATPALRLKLWASYGGMKRLFVWSAARYLGALGANALLAASQLAIANRMKYREATQHAAQVSLQYLAPPTALQIAGFQEPEPPEMPELPPEASY